MIRNAVNRHIGYRLLIAALSVLFGFAPLPLVFLDVWNDEPFPGFLVFTAAWTGIILAVWLGGFYGGTALFWLVIRDQHPWIKPLHEFGDPFEALDSIEADIRAGPFETFREPFSFTFWANVRPALVLSPNWLVHLRKTSSAIIPLADIVWVYRQHGRHTHWWGGAASFHTVLIYGIRRGPYLIELSDKESSDWLGTRLVERKPEALFGDSDEYRKLERRGIESLIDALRSRQEEYMKLSPAEQREWRKDALDDYVKCVHAWEV